MSLRSWILPGALSGLFAGIASLPLSWVAPIFTPDALSALRFEGSVWQGAVSGLPVFGTANFRLHPLDLSAGIEAGDGLNYLRARAGRSRAEDVRLVLDLSTLPFTDGRLQGLIGSIRAELSEVDYGPQGCAGAQGTLRTDVLQRNGGAIDWTGPELVGPLTCDSGTVLADLSGEDAQQTVRAQIRLSADGSYRADITVRTSRAEAGAVLPLFGFSRDGPDFKLTEQGQWR